MDYGIECEYNKEKGSFTILNDNINITITDKKIKFNILDIISVHIKDIQEKTKTNFAFLIKLTTQTNNHIISFKNYILRDALKTFFTSKILEREKILNDIKANKEIENLKENKNDLVKYKSENIMDGYEYHQIENTKSALIDFLIAKPILLKIFDEMNCQPHQFYNYLKQSYFYNIKNKNNVIDRMLNEKLRNYTIKDDGFATRINNHSFLCVNDEVEQKEIYQKINEKEIDFVPLYPKKERFDNNKINNFYFPDTIKLDINIDIVIENEYPSRDYDMTALSKLSDLCKKAYKTDKNNEEAIRQIIIETDMYKDLFKDKNLEGFDPKRYLH